MFSITVGSQNERNKLISQLNSKKIPSVIYYKYPIHLMEGFKYLGYKQKDLPVSEFLSKIIVSLPMHPYLIDEELEKIEECINRK